MAPIMSARRRGALAPVLILAALCLGGATVCDARDLAEDRPQQLSSELSDMLSPQDAALLALPTTRDHIGRIVVQAMVNGKGPFRFVVDTGATQSTLSPGLVRTLGLTPSATPSILVNGITGSEPVSAVSLDTLRAGDLTFDDVVAPIVWAPVMAGADGILGIAGLREKSLSVDFLRNRAEIARAVDSGVRQAGLRIHASQMTHGLMTLEMRVGGVRALAIIDTGAERTLGNHALYEALHLHRRAGAVTRVTSVYGATPEIEPGEIWRAPTLVIDTLRINDVDVVYGDFHIFKVWQMQDQPAMIVGMDVLGTVASLGIDFKNRDVYFTNSRSSSETLRSTGNLASPGQRR
ncbi:MAG: aspartyl protease family protein [Proteobacteria bacterium]|nr:aspartyl protease family protein [Pseudomonadota bacterium]